MIDIEKAQKIFAETQAEVAKVIIGQEKVIKLALMTITARSHALIEGVPGIAKTLLVRTLGKTMNADTGRIQFTPDLMPSDITGTNIFNLKDNEFKLFKGPIFTSFLLADEINRAPAKTQAALLQAMQERNVSIDNTTYSLPYAFTVFATQNPVEFEGTYPLPEAQKDRFLIKIEMSYPNKQDETTLVQNMLSGNSPEKVLDSGKIQSVFPVEQLPYIENAVNSVHVKPEMIDYIVEIVRMTRTHSSVLLGAGPRATQAFILTSRINAIMEGRDFIIPEDIKSMAIPILHHRIILKPEFEIEGLEISEVISQILEKVATPR